MAQESGGVVVVTGASAGVGRAAAQLFGEKGWRVGLIARDAERLERTKRDIESAGGQALVSPADVADPLAVDRARDQALERWGVIDVWVNAAMATVVSPISRMTAEEYRRVTEVTYLGYVHGALAALAHMRGRDRGAIVQVGSALAYRSIPLQSAYCAAKAAVRGFTDSLRTELRHEGSAIRLSMVQLPGVNTPQFDWARNKLGRKHKPVSDVFQPEVAARAIHRAALEGPRELWVGLSAMQAIVGQLAAPAILDRMLARQAWEGQLDPQLPLLEGQPDNLFDPVPGDPGAHGRFDSTAKDRAWVLDPDAGRIALGAGLSAFAGLTLAAAFAAGRRTR
ncbi:MAG: SDR family oxidoreductase [Pseudomonadota bacterium]|nr:SDR family oxidoreductase [Pseudomonadota bacterium]